MIRLLLNLSKSLARRVNSSSEADVSQLKRVGKYIVKHPMTSNEFVDQSMFKQIRVHVDTDHAGMCTHRPQYDGTRDDAREAL